MQVFYFSDAQLGLNYMPEEESKHMVKVLRMRQNEAVYVIDGKGNLYEGHISGLHPRQCEIELTKINPAFEQRNYHLHMAISPLKNMDRFEWFVEKAVEIGVDEITPLLCHRTERDRINMERLDRIVESAMKQSLKAYKPGMNALTRFSSFITEPYEGKKLIAHCTTLDKAYILSQLTRRERVLILIGPEGDFTEEEVTLAFNNGFQGIDLGKSRLRTETAGLAACLAVSLVNGG